MQPQNGQLSKGFIPVEDAIKLIRKDTRDEATVDLDFMVKNIHYIQDNKNFRIPLMKSDEKKIAHRTGSVYVYIQGAYQKEALKEAIREMFKERTNRDINTEGKTYNKTTVQDDEHNAGARIMANPNPPTTAGDDLGRGETL